MERNKLISVRIDNYNLARIEDLIAGAPYLNRSRVINVILSAVLQCCGPGEVWQILNAYDPLSDGIQIHVYAPKKHIHSTH